MKSDFGGIATQKSKVAGEKMMVRVYRVPQMQDVGHADVLLYFKCLSDAVPCECVRF